MTLYIDIENLNLGLIAWSTMKKDLLGLIFFRNIKVQ